MSKFGVFRIYRNAPVDRESGFWRYLLAAVAISLLGFTFGWYGRQYENPPETHIRFNNKTCVLDMGGAIVDPSAASLFSTWLVHNRCT